MKIAINYSLENLIVNTDIAIFLYHWIMQKTLGSAEVIQHTLWYAICNSPYNAYFLNGSDQQLSRLKPKG